MSLQNAKMPRLLDKLEEATAQAEKLREKKEKLDMEVDKAIKKVTSKKK